MTVKEFLKDVRFICRRIDPHPFLGVCSATYSHTLIYNNVDERRKYLNIYTRSDNIDECEYYPSGADSLLTITPDKLDKIIFDSGNVINIRESLNHVKFIFKGSDNKHKINKVTEF